MNSNIQSCIIVGAGISGLLAAQRLRDYHIDVTILEKSRASGGRMAKKMVDDAVFDIGAQFMTTRERNFRERVERWMSKSEVLPWYTGPLGNMRYVGLGGMTTVPSRIASELNVLYSQKVVKVAFKSKRWHVTTQPHGSDATQSFSADWLILTAPVPQSLQLLADSGINLDFDEEEELQKIHYVRCISVYALLKGPAGLPNPGAMDLNHDALRWIGDNFAKKISPVEGAITIHSSPRFANAFWDRPEQEQIDALLTAAKPFLKSEPLQAWRHRWRFSEPTRIYKEKQPFRKPFFIDDAQHLGMCGDAFNGPRIESAGLSGMALASAIINPF